jgi:hypothetical protein
MTVFFAREGVARPGFARIPAILLLRRGGSTEGGTLRLLLLIVRTGSRVPIFLAILSMNWP